MGATADELIEEMAREWRTITDAGAAVLKWEQQLGSLETEMQVLRTQGQWRSGGRTLLRALWLHHDEVILCRGLAWLLTPDGWHGLGSMVLVGLLEHLGLPTTDADMAQIITEEQRQVTRADIIVRYPEATLLFEAKVWAGEQVHQADRLASEWSDEEPVLVFLTRDGRPPATAIESAGEWHLLSWHDLANIVKQAIRNSLDPAPGAVEYLLTLDHYGGFHG